MRSRCKWPASRRPFLRAGHLGEGGIVHDITSAAPRTTYAVLAEARDECAEFDARRQWNLRRLLRWGVGTEAVMEGCHSLFAAAAVVAVVAVMTEARAVRVIDGNRLYELCRPNSRSSTFCGDYVLSIADALMMGRVGRWTASIPSGVTGDQVVDVAMRFVDAHPARRGSAASELVAEALAEAFSCK